MLGARVCLMYAGSQGDGVLGVGIEFTSCWRLPLAGLVRNLHGDDFPDEPVSTGRFRRHRLALGDVDQDERLLERTNSSRHDR